MEKFIQFTDFEGIDNNLFCTITRSKLKMYEQQMALVSYDSYELLVRAYEI